VIYYPYMFEDVYSTRIKCTHCLGSLRIAIYEKDYGILKCQRCGEEFPIIKNIPRLLKGKLLTNCYGYYREYILKVEVLTKYFERQARETAGQNYRDGAEKLESNTQSQFAYEWDIWRKLPDFAENHFFNVAGFTPRDFLGKTGWDPAIGNGRDLHDTAVLVGERGLMIGSDLSFSVDIAYERCKDLQNVVIVQADLYTQFLDNESLDFVYLIGLVQHLPYPKKAIELAYNKVKPGGTFFGTVYTKPTASF